MKDAPAPRPNKRPRLATPARAPVPTVASDAKKSQPGAATSKEGDDALSAEFLNVMNPRTRKGPAWADGGAPVPVTSKTGQREPSPRPQGAQERAGADAAGNDVSDLDWMRSRMTKGIREGNEFEQSDEEAGELDDVEMANVGKVVPRFPLRPCRALMLGLSIARRSVVRAPRSARRHPADYSLHRASVRPQLDLFMYYGGTARTVWTIWTN